MKKIFILATFLLGVLFLACNNNSTPQNSTSEDKQDTIPALLFTPEEIAYNDSIKNLPMDYIQKEETIYTNSRDSMDVKRYVSEYELKGVTQQQVYLDLYDSFCNIITSRVRLFVNKRENSLYLKKYSIKLLNDKGNDIIPLIDFPDRRVKEDSIWNEWMKYYLENPIPNINPSSMYKQPIINKGDSLYIEFSLSNL